MVLTEKDFEKRKNDFYSLVARQNGPPALGQFSRPFNHESLVMDSQRYTDLLIRDKLHDIYNPAHRERVAMEDPVANLLTWGFAFNAWDKLPKFYESEQLGSLEILPELREFLSAIDFKELAVVVGALVAIHGWCIVRPWADETGRLRYEVFSDNQINDTDWLRDSQRKVIGWRVLKSRKELPLRRSSEGICVSGKFEDSMEIILREDVIYVTRGDEQFSQGFGYSRLEQVWDSITKLREKSHADHFRSRVFPISIVPPNWDDNKVSEFFKALSLMDMSRAMVVRSGVDSQNNPVPELPSINWMSPAQNAPGQSSAVSGSDFSDLNSDWARICAVSKHTIAYFVGGGVISSSLAAAGVDDNKDLRTDISEFNNIFNIFILDFVEFLNEKYGLGLPVEGGLAIKSHWEWTRDEQMIMVQQQQQQMMDQQNEMEKKTKNIAPGQFVPVNSTSGNVRLVGVEPAGPMENTDKIYVKFKEPYGWYKYSDPEMDVDTVTDDIAARGGEAIWDNLRGRDGAMGYPEKSAPNARRYDQQGNRLKYPNVGRGHQVSYMGVSGPGLGPTSQSQMAGDGRGQIPMQQAVAAGVLQHRGTASRAAVDFAPRPRPRMGVEQHAEALEQHQPRVEQIFQPVHQLQQQIEESRAPREPEPPRRGRPRKKMKGGTLRFYEPGRRGRMSAEEYLAKQTTQAQEQSQSELGQIFEDIVRRDYERYQQQMQEYEQIPTEEEEFETLTEEDFADVEEPEDRLGRIRRALRTFTRGARRVARIGRVLTRNAMDELDDEDYLHPWFQNFNSISETARELQIGKKSIYIALEGIETASMNSATYLGNSFSTKNPFIYLSNGFPTIEYQCSDAIRALIGVEAPIIYSHQNADEDNLEPINQDCVIGRYRIIGYDEDEGHEIAKYELDEDKIRKNGLGWLLDKINQGNLPETSTAYFNKLKYDRDRQRFIQTDFRLKHVAIVEKGNCRPGHCELFPVRDREVD